MERIFLADNVFGPLETLIQNNDITDIDWNGRDLWITDLNKGRYLSEIKLDHSFLEQLSMKISNLMNQTFNQYEPKLEAETDKLRISIIHEGITNTGMSVSIRKTPPIKRINRDIMLKQDYCSEVVDNFMQNAIKAHCNIFIAGLPSVGKTEYLKALTTYIPASERVITIEDNFEIRYSQINPGKDCVELRVGDRLDYSDLIKACLRQNPKWILLSEARGSEVTDLLKSLSTGTYCLTTGHANDAMNIPSRMLNMMGESTERNIDDIYTYIDIGVLIKKDDTVQPIHRWIAQIVLFTHDEKKGNRTHLLYENGTFLFSTLPEELQKKFNDANITNPFQI